MKITVVSNSNFAIAWVNDKCATGRTWWAALLRAFVARRPKR